MASQAQSLSELFSRQAELSAAQTSISQELVVVNQKILFLLAGHSRSAADDVVSTPIDVKSGSAKATRSGRRSWFARGEALKLLNQVSKRALKPAEAVRAVLARKGYDKISSKEDLKRVSAVLHQAILFNVKAGKLLRDKTGRVQTK